LFESAEIATFTPQEKIKLEFDMRTERDIKNQIAYAKKEGREEGREEERIRIVENLRKLGISEEKIASAIEAK
jgi:predicted transposase YdaD